MRLAFHGAAETVTGSRFLLETDRFRMLGVRSSVTFLDFQAAGTRGDALVRGEAASADALRRRLRDELGWPAEVPLQHECHELI